MDAEKSLNVDSVDSFKKQYGMLETIINSMESGIWISDREGNMIILNSSAQNEVGLNNVGRNVLEIVNELEIFETDGSELLPENIPVFKALKGETVKGEKLIRHLKTGELRHRGYMVSPIRDENGGIIGSVSVSEDITDKKRVEQELLEAHNKYQTVFETAQEGILYKNIQTGGFQCNQSFADMLGYLKEDICWMKFKDIVFDIGNHENKRAHATLAEGFSISGEAGLRHKNGSELWVLYNATPVFDAEGEHIANFAMFTDITARKAIERNLEKSKKRALDLVGRLRESRRQRNEFLSALSHELRNPLATIMMGLSLFEQVSMDKGEEQKIRKMIMRQAGQLSRLVDDLLDMTRIEQNRFELKKRFLELNGMIKHISLDDKPLFIEKEITLETRIASEKIYVEGDPVRLTQVIENLLHNALKFTSKGGRVTLVLDKDQEAEKAIISVTDTGEGISSEQLGEVFKPFIRIGHSYDKNIAGLGIGLFVVKEIINRHGGDIEASSEGLGKGAKFIIKLPLID